MTSDLVSYRNQAFNFLHTITVKFSPLADLINDNLINKGVAVNLNDQTTWKYYINMTGNYHPSDEIMTVVSLDTRSVVEFRPAMLSAHPRTRRAYRPGSSEYNELCARYPSQVDLIKSIVYPVEDIVTAITAQNLTILSYGADQLEEWELLPIVKHLQTFLDYWRDRWYFGFFAYEIFYNWTFWSITWQLLAQQLFESRVRNIGTSAVHSFHIWEYLTSHGLSDYRDILNRTQQLYLYRNLRYLQDEVGTQDNLRRLVDNILEPIQAGLVAKIAYQQTDGLESECRWAPEILSEKVPTRYADVLQEVPMATLDRITARLYADGYETRYSPEYVDSLSRSLGATNINRFATKILEIRPIQKDRKYAPLLGRFALDTLVDHVSRGMYDVPVIFVDKYLQQEIRLTPGDAMALWHYCQARIERRTPVTLPTLYASSIGFRHDATIGSIPYKFDYRGSKYTTQSIFDLSWIMDGIVYPDIPIRATQDFEDKLASQFLAKVRHVERSRYCADATQMHALEVISNAVCNRTTYHPNFAPEALYTEWLQRTGLGSLISLYDQSGDYATLYDQLALDIMAQLIPMNHPTLVEYADLVVDREFYRRLRTLFDQLCSYSVVFIDSSGETFGWLPVGKTIVYRQGVQFSSLQRVGVLNDVQLEHNTRIVDTFATDVQVTIGADVRIRDSVDITTKVSGVMGGYTGVHPIVSDGVVITAESSSFRPALDYRPTYGLSGEFVFNT
jgi:hypothetical protein